MQFEMACSHQGGHFQNKTKHFHGYIPGAIVNNWVWCKNIESCRFACLKNMNLPLHWVWTFFSANLQKEEWHSGKLRSQVRIPIGPIPHVTEQGDSLRQHRFTTGAPVSSYITLQIAQSANNVHSALDSMFDGGKHVRIFFRINFLHNSLVGLVFHLNVA
jgi:hypothetical protein